MFKKMEDTLLWIPGHHRMACNGEDLFTYSTRIGQTQVDGAPDICQVEHWLFVPNRLESQSLAVDCFNWTNMVRFFRLYCAVGAVV